MASGDKKSQVVDAADDGELVAREYLRVSFDRSGRERSNGEQHDDNRSAWPYRFEMHYSDTVSASRYSTKVRGDWLVLMGDLRADRFGADVLVLWESSRGSRKVGEWVELIDLCEERAVLIAVTEHHRVYDPSNARDRRSLLEDAVDSEYESAKISGRTLRTAAANARAGRPQGPVPFGYKRTYDPVTRQLVAQEPVPAEAKVVKELFRRLAKGHSLRSIAIDFDKREIRARSGKRLSAEVLRNMARRDLYRGVRSHTVGAYKMGQTERIRNATRTDAVWPGIVSEKQFLAVQRILEDPARMTTRPGRGKYLLSMIMPCDVCRGPMAVTYTGNKDNGGQYYCHVKGCCRIDRPPVDEIVEAAIIGYLSRPDIIEQLTAGDANDEVLAAARTEVAQIRAELDELADQVGRGLMSATLAARAEPQIEARLKVAERRAQELATPSELAGLIEPGKKVATAWAGMPMSAKRRVARLVLTRDALGEVRVIRSTVRGKIKQPAIERLVWENEPEPAPEPGPDAAEPAGG
jgi:DNA invertase Pin-like site-specific DNA recombinase